MRNRWLARIGSRSVCLGACSLDSLPAKLKGRDFAALVGSNCETPNMGGRSGVPAWIAAGLHVTGVAFHGSNLKLRGGPSTSAISALGGQLRACTR